MEELGIVCDCSSHGVYGLGLKLKVGLEAVEVYDVLSIVYVRVCLAFLQCGVYGLTVIRRYL